MPHPPLPVFLPNERFVTLPFSSSQAPARVWKVNEQGIPQPEKSTVTVTTSPMPPLNQEENSSAIREKLGFTPTQSNWPWRGEDDA